MNVHFDAAELDVSHVSRHVSPVPGLAKAESAMFRRHRPGLRAESVPVPGQQGDPVQDEPL